MTLRVSGFDQARQGISNEEVLRVICELIPEPERQGVQELVYEPAVDLGVELRADRTGRVHLDIEYAMRQRYAKQAELGFHELRKDSGFERIVIRTTEDMDGNILHEFGHSVQNRLSSQAKSEWSRLHVLTAPEAFISERASADEDEDFAECYALFRLKPARLRELDPKKLAFLESNLNALRDV